ncbi:MAG: calcium-binding protein [Candidatus Omnitrophica bacterium]|nr:calcium-binding protein [Candidatus Omnitrophota bacterium]
MANQRINKAREHRIEMEAVVDAYGSEERAMGWYYYLEDRVEFPFKAKCICEKAASPLKKSEVVEAKAMAPETECEHDMFVQIRWNGRKLAEEVFSELDGLEVEELWDRSGPSREGYSDPGEMAYEMLEEVLEPFLAEIRKYHKLAKPKEAKFYCMGVLKRISQYEKESKSEFKGWAGDGVGECSQWVLLEWEKGNQSADDRKEMKEFYKHGNNESHESQESSTRKP